MTKYYSTSSSPLSPQNPKHNKWIIAGKIVAWCLGILIILAGIAIWIISSYFNPTRIKDLIEEKGSQYLNADIRIGNLDYKLFRTYPWFEFEIDSLIVISKSLDGVPNVIRDSLPISSDSLAMVNQLKGKVNIHDLMHDKVVIKGINIVQPKVNIVMVNDSVTNYNILPKLPKVKKMPELDIAGLDVAAPVVLNFFSLQNEAKAAVEVESFTLLRENANSYKIGFDGFASGSYKEFILPQKIPLKFNTGIYLNLPEYTVKLDNLFFNLAGLSVNARGEVIANKSGVDIQNAAFSIEIADIFTLINYLPSQIIDLIPMPEGLSGVLPFNLSLNLLEPFQVDKALSNPINLYNLPAMSAVLKVEDANLNYHPDKGRPIFANDVYLEAVCDFNPHDSIATSLDLKQVRIMGEGITLSGNAFIDNLTGHSQSFHGDVYFRSPVMETLSYLIPKSGLKIAGILKGEVNFSGKALNMGKGGFKDLALEGDIESGSLKVKSGIKNDFSIKKLRGNYKADIPQYPLSNYAGTKLDLDILADSLDMKSNGSRMAVTAFELTLDAVDTVSGSPNPYGLLTLKLGNLDVRQGETSFVSDRIALSAKGSLNSSIPPTYPTVPPYSGGDDALIYSKIEHTPTLLVYNGGGMVQTLMTMVDIDADLLMGKACFKSPSYIYPIIMEGLKLSTDLNKVKFSASDVTISRSSFSSSGEILGLKPFITTSSATTLKGDVTVDFNNVDINQLSWGYYGALVAAGADSVFFVPPMQPFTAADSVCVAIPRNLDAIVHLKSKAAEYMQYSFAPLSTDIIVKNGEATLKQLTVGTPYCTAVVDWTYSTSRLDNIFMNLHADVKNFNFSHFYKTFPSLVDRNANLKNFTGLVNSQIDCYFNMFPSMFMNEASLAGNFSLTGSDMEFQRSGKIERITHLMLIEGTEPIKIQNIDITGHFHDNLFQLNPFKVAFDNYQLELGGINNTVGDMYYHIALEKSPFHMPFGVSVFGKMKHPEIRVGGTRINDYKSELVSMDPESKLNINIMAWLKHGWTLFIQEAAKYEGSLEKNTDNE